MSVARSELVEIRDSLPGDHNFIMATFLRGLYYGDSWFSLINKDVFMANYHAFVEALLKRPDVNVKVACLKEDKEVILGYAIMRKSVPTVDWVFVKAAWRKIGIAKSLIPDNTLFCTHLTKVGLSIMKNHSQLSFNPFL